MQGVLEPGAPVPMVASGKSTIFNDPWVNPRTGAETKAPPEAPAYDENSYEPSAGTKARNETFTYGEATYEEAEAEDGSSTLPRRAMPESSAGTKARNETFTYGEATYEEAEAEDGSSTLPRAMPSEAHYEPQVRAPRVGRHADKVWAKTMQNTPRTTEAVDATGNARSVSEADVRNYPTVGDRPVPGSPEFETLRTQAVVIQRLQKKLCQIEVLRQRVQQGCELDAAQHKTLRREAEVRATLETAERQYSREHGLYRPQHLHQPQQQPYVAVAQIGPNSEHKESVPLAQRPQQPRATEAQIGPESPRERVQQSALAQRPQQPRVGATQIGPESPRERVQQSALAQRPQQPRVGATQIGPESPRERVQQSALAQRPQQPRVGATQIGPESPRERVQQSALAQRPQQPRVTGPESPCERVQQSALAQRPQLPRVGATQTGPESPCERVQQSALAQRPQLPRVGATQIGPESSREREEQSALAQRPQQPRVDATQIGPESPRERGKHLPRDTEAQPEPRKPEQQSEPEQQSVPEPQSGSKPGELEKRGSRGAELRATSTETEMPQVADEPSMAQVDPEHMLDDDPAVAPTFEQDDLVWAKIRGFPWWPARVAGTLRTDAEGERYPVRFFHTTERIELSPMPSTPLPYSSREDLADTTKIKSKAMRTKFEKALRELTKEPTKGAEEDPTEGWRDEGHEYLGRRVARPLEGSLMVLGRITRWLPAGDGEDESPLFHVDHDDGDKEVLEEYGVINAFELYKTTPEATKFAQAKARAEARAAKEEEKAVKAEARAAKASERAAAATTAEDEAAEETKKKREAEHGPRVAKTAVQFYTAAESLMLTATHPGLDALAIAEMIKAQGKVLEEADKAAYMELAAADKQRHEAECASEKQGLNTLKDGAGVSTYDDQKAKSLRTLADSEDNTQRCKEQTTTIETKLAGLAAEKDELEAYTRLDRRRKVVEYTYYHTELMRAKSGIASSVSKRAQSSEMASRSATDDEELTSTTKEHERQLRVLGESLKSAVAETKARAAEHKKRLEHTARLDADHKAEEVAHTKREKEAELEQVDASIADVEQNLGELEPRAALQNAAAAAAREMERIEAVLLQLHSKEAGGHRFSSKKERDKHLTKEAELLREAIDKKSEQAKSLEKELDAAKYQRQKSEEHEAERRSKADERRKRVADAQDKCARWRTEYAEPTDQRKQLWRRDANVRKERKAIEEQLAKPERTLAHSMSRNQWEALDACKRIVREKRIKCAHGLLLELIRCDGKFNTAVNVAAGNQLLHMVVDSDDVTPKLVEELKQASAGRATFMPLNRLRVKPEPDPGEGVMPFVPKGRATLGLKWKNKGEGVPKDGVEFENAPLTAALEKQLKSASPKHAFTEEELRALGVAKGRLSLNSYVKAAGPGDKVFYFKPAYLVLQFRERFRHVFHKTVFAQTGAAKPREHDVNRVTLAGDKAICKGSMSSGWHEARKSRRAQADLAQLRGRLKALDANLTQLERDKEQHEARALETQGELDKHTVAHNKRPREADLEDVLEAIDTGTTGGGGTDRGGAESSSSGITGGVIGTSRDARKAVNKQKKSAHKALQAAIESDQEQLRAVQQALKANFEPDGKPTDAGRRELTEKQEQLREKRRERDAAAPAAARAHASVSSLRASLSEDLRNRQDEFKEALERTIDADAAGDEWQSGGAAAEELCVAKERLAAAAEVLDASRKIADTQRARAQTSQASQERLDEMCFKAADAAKGRADTAKQVDMLLQKKAILQQKAEVFEQHICKLGTLPQQAYAATGAHTSMSFKQMRAEIQQCVKSSTRFTRRASTKRRSTRTRPSPTSSKSSAPCTMSSRSCASRRRHSGSSHNHPRRERDGAHEQFHGGRAPHPRFLGQRGYPGHKLRLRSDG